MNGPIRSIYALPLGYVTHDEKFWIDTYQPVHDGSSTMRPSITVVHLHHHINPMDQVGFEP